MILPHKTDRVAQQVAVKSAVNPSLWACFVISTPLFLLSSKMTGWFSISSFIVACVPIIAFAFSYFFLLFKNPEYLRSEDYQLRMETLRLFGTKDNPLNAGAGDIVSVITNPGLPSPQEKNE